MANGREASQSWQGRGGSMQGAKQPSRGGARRRAALCARVRAGRREGIRGEKDVREREKPGRRRRLGKFPGCARVVLVR